MIPGNCWMYGIVAYYSAVFAQQMHLFLVLVRYQGEGLGCLHPARVVVADR